MITISSKNKAVSREALKEVPIISSRPVSKRWVGIGHYDLASCVVNTLEGADLEITKEVWYLDRGGSALLGGINIKPSPEIGMDLELGTPAEFSLAVRHSNDGRYAVTFGVGAQIFLCSNGVLSAEFVLKKMHTKNLDLQKAVEEGVMHYISEAQKINGRVRKMSGAPVSDADAALILFRLNEINAVAFRHLEEMYKNWSQPLYDEFKPRTAWSLYNACTSAIKDFSPTKQYECLLGLMNTIDHTLNLNLLGVKN